MLVFRFNKDMEYALISLVEMSRQEESQLISARELSTRYAIPFKLLARILQKLSADGLVHAVKGSRGGYRLNEKPGEIKISRVLGAVRGEEKIADCLSSHGKCDQDRNGCTIKPVIRIFQDKWMHFIEGISLDEFIQ